MNMRYAGSKLCLGGPHFVSLQSRANPEVPASWPALLILGCVTFAVAPSDIINAQELLIQGDIAHFVHDQGRKVLRNSFQFEIDISGNMWRNKVRDLRVSEGKKDSPEWYINAFDGSDHYKVIRFRREGGRTNEYAFVKTGELSTDESLALNTLWIAFESGDYFRHLKEALMVGPFPHGPTNKVRFSCGWKLKVSGLPGRLEFYLPGWEVRHLKRQAPRSDQGLLVEQEPVIIHYPPPFSEGYLAGVFTTSKTSFVAGLEVPSEFQFERYVLRRRGTNDFERVLFETTVFRCSHIKEFNERGNLDLIPSLSVGAHVHDFRFTNIAAHVAYSNDGEGWLSRTNPHVSSQIKTLLARRSRKMPLSLVSIQVLIVSVFVAPFLVYLLNKKLRKRVKFSCINKEKQI